MTSIVTCKYQLHNLWLIAQGMTKINKAKTCELHFIIRAVANMYDCIFMTKFYLLTLNLPNFLNGIIIFHFWNCPLSFMGYQDENLKLVSQQYRAWSDCTDVQAGLAQYWWQRLITFSVGRIRVKPAPVVWKKEQTARNGIEDFNMYNEKKNKKCLWNMYVP